VLLLGAVFALAGCRVGPSGSLRSTDEVQGTAAVQGPTAGSTAERERGVPIQPSELPELLPGYELDPTSADNTRLGPAVEKLRLALEIASQPIMTNTHVMTDLEVREQIRSAFNQVAEALGDHEVLSPLSEDLIALEAHLPPMGASYDPNPRPFNAYQELLALKEKLERLLSLAASPVDFWVRSEPNEGAAFALVPKHETQATRRGLCHQQLTKVVRGHYILTITNGTKSCQCELELYDQPPSQVTCHLALGGECHRQ